MNRQQVFGLVILLSATAAVIGMAGTTERPEETPGEWAAYEALLDASPVAELEGEPVSPDGRFQIRTVGKSDLYVSGLVPPERLQIADASTGEILWEDMGYLRQSVLWSPDGSYAALAYAGRTWNKVRIFETDTWTSWDFTLPDGSPIPEYTFLSWDQPWGEWVRQKPLREENVLLLTMGRDGEGEEQHTYRCALLMDGGQLTGNTLEQTAEILPVEYDFDHDGEPEAAELVTVWGEQAAWYELYVKKRDGRLLWSDWAAAAHAGYNSLFACTLDGEDYLLRYHPTMYQGYCTYGYQLFSLNPDGGEVVLREDAVEFDINWNSPAGHNFDPAAIAGFMEDVNGLLSHSRLLLTTDDALEGIDPEHPRDDLWWLVGNDAHLPPDETGYTYDETTSLEENLRRFAAVMTQLTRQ